MRNLIVGFITLLIVVCVTLSIFPQQTAVAATNDITVQAIQGPTLAQEFLTRAQSSWPWYIVRASGIVAALALILLLLSGVGQITGSTFRFLEPLTAWASHRALGIAFGVAVLIHMFGLLFDRFVPFTLWQILIPWLSDYRPLIFFGINVGSLYVALGVLAFYLVAIIVITSLLWVEKKPHLWKWLHLLSYIVMLFVFVHALYLGTDLTDGWMRWLWIILAVIIVLFTIQRLWRAKTI